MQNNEIVTASVQNNTATPQKQVQKAQKTPKYEIAHGNFNTQPTAQVNANTGAQSNAMGSPTQGKNMYDENGNAQVRQMLVNRGISNDRIGYDTNKGMVTIDGVGYTMPGYVKDGVSYADEKTINSLTNQAYKQSGDELVSAAQYSAESGFGNMVKWDQNSGTLSVGGININPVYVSGDNIAYVRKSDIDKAMASAKQNAGVQGDRQVYENWAKQYGPEIAQAYNNVKNFKYDPNTDNEYQAFMKYQMQQKQKLAEDAAARAMDATGGYGGANIGAIADSMFDSQQEIASAIPQYAEQAYNRARNTLSDAIYMGNNDYEKEYTANRDAADRFQYALDSDWQRRKDAVEMAQRAKEYESLNYRNSVDDRYYDDRAKLGLSYDSITLDEALNNIIWSLMQQAGKISTQGADNMGITMPGGRFISLTDLADGQLPDNLYQPQYDAQYWSALAAGRAQNQIERERMWL